MILDQYYLSCLSQASYLVADPGSRRAAVIDPRRDVKEYLTDAEAQGLSIELVILTHVHADFIPGHTELAERTGAEIAMGEVAPVQFPIRRLRDGERITLGDPETGVVLEVLATPGHTPESITLAIYEHGSDPAPHSILTGDTLFLGDVGRPDLLGAAGRTSAEMARELFQSLRGKILPLPDEVLVYPGHGAGSACGKALSTDTVSTLGDQRRTNYALAPMSEDDFVAVVTDGLGAPPAYFADEVAVNKVGHVPFDEDQPVPRTDGTTAVRRQQAGYLLLDVRDDQAFAAGHLKGSVNVGLSGRFAEYAAALHAPEQPVILVGSDEQNAEARLRLARVGVDQVTAQVNESILVESPELVVASSRLTASQAAEAIKSTPDLQVVDVRGPGEHKAGALPGAVNLCVTRLRTTLDQLDPAKPVLVHCAGGYRSMAAASLLEANGFHDVSDVLGGYTAWAADPSAA
ncbi:MBL fold metallo-hydrolase [Sporichthya sp.]|uniref:MBL fold metallo-hydrolase n=1 Tax=Sporichthya sp. TaxID=65475 RepID=UPI0017DC4ED4|nr:MBL fold metallo-hydrolase [Sporichthya sp.]MBA3741723.1 MBL fold metallo-hydrolase [Sporichthya sp.]